MDINKIKSKKGVEKIVMLTCYDYQSAKILDKLGLDMILVGDSLGMVFKGEINTKNVTMEDMMYHIKAVRRGVKNTPIIGDMPIHSYDTPAKAFKNAQLFIDAGADGVKIEGNHYEIIKKLVKNSINVMGHIGLLPQSYKTYKVVGREEEEKISLINDAISIEKAGAFSVVLESMPENLGGKITNAVQIPTIGIGAGRYCDGQVLVINDLLGMDPDFHPKFVKRYLNLYQLISNSVNSFIKDVKEGNYPDSEHIYE